MVKFRTREAIDSLLWNTARAEYFNSPREMFSERCSVPYDLHKLIHFNSHNREHSQIKEVVRQLVDEPEELYVNQFDEALFGQTATKQQALAHYSLHTVRFCPECMSESSYHHIEWNVNVITVCPEHQVYLVDHCSNCQRPVTFHAMMTGTCRCGRGLYRDKCTPPDQVIAAQQSIYRLLIHGEDVITKNEQRLDSVEFITAMEHLWRLIEGLEGSHPVVTELGFDINTIKPLSQSKKDVKLMSLVTTIIHHMITDPRQAVGRILPEVYELITSGKYPHKRRYINDVMSLDNSIGLQEIQDQLVQGRGRLNGRGKKKQMDPDVLSVLDTIRYLHTSHGRVKQLEREGAIQRCTGGYRRQSVEICKEVLADSMTSNEVSKLLGLTYQQVRALMHTGFIHKRDQSRKVVFERSEIEDVLFQISACVQEVSVMKPGWVRLTDLMFHTRQSGLSLDVLLRGLIGGEVRALTFDQSKAIEQMYFHLDEVRKWSGK